MTGRTQAARSIDAVVRHTVVTLSAAQVRAGTILTVLSIEHLLVELVNRARTRVSVGPRFIGALSAEQAGV